MAAGRERPLALPEKYDPLKFRESGYAEGTFDGVSGQRFVGDDSRFLRSDIIMDKENINAHRYIYERDEVFPRGTLLGSLNSLLGNSKLSDGIVRQFGQSIGISNATMQGKQLHMEISNNQTGLVFCALGSGNEELFKVLINNKVGVRIVDIGPEGRKDQVLAFVNDDNAYRPVMYALEMLRVNAEAGWLLDRARALPGDIQQVVQEELQKAQSGTMNWELLFERLQKIRQPLEEYARGYQKRQRMIPADFEAAKSNKKTLARQLGVDSQAGEEVADLYKQGELVDRMCKSAGDLARGQVSENIIDFQGGQYIGTAQSTYIDLDKWISLIGVLKPEMAGVLLRKYAEIYASNIAKIVISKRCTIGEIINLNNDFLNRLPSFGLSEQDEEGLRLILCRAYAGLSLNYPLAYGAPAIQQGILTLAKTPENRSTISGLLGKT